MPSVGEVAGVITRDFDRTRSVLLEDAVFDALLSLGMSSFDAGDVADARFLAAVRRRFETTQPQRLPFDLSASRPDRLIGKGRPRAGDTEETKSLRKQLTLLAPLRAALAALGDSEFELLSSVVMLRVGAQDARVTPHGNEGGVDFYGRMPVLVGDASIPAGLVRTTLDVRPLLFLGQAKRFTTSATVDRSELQKFAGQVRDCLNKYAGMVTPPAHRVPDDYYESGEPCLAFFVTTAGFSPGARDYARSVNMILADGHLLAELLVYWGFGRKDLASVDSTAVLDWVTSVRTATPLQQET